jgi:hypothetical protein
MCSILLLVHTRSLPFLVLALDIIGQTNSSTCLINLTVQILNQAYTNFRINAPVVMPTCLPGYIHSIPNEKISLYRQNGVTSNPLSISR